MLGKKEKEHKEPEKKDGVDSLVQIKESELESLKKELQEHKKKSEEYFDRLLRLQAEFDNSKKRMQRDREEFVKYASEQVIVELLGILDDLERSVEARESNQQDPAAFLKGIEMILSHLYELLKKYNVRPIEAKGKKFDPHQHEALMQVQTDAHEEDTVIAEFQKGYMLGEKVVRTSKVQVAKKPEKANAPEAPKDQAVSGDHTEHKNKND